MKENWDDEQQSFLPEPQADLWNALPAAVRDAALRLDLEFQLGEVAYPAEHTSLVLRELDRLDMRLLGVDAWRDAAIAPAASLLLETGRARREREARLDRLLSQLGAGRWYLVFVVQPRSIP